MVTWTDNELTLHNMRLEARRPMAHAADAVEAECELHQDILDYCRSRGWLAFHGSMVHRSRRTPGEFDFIILAEYPRVLWIECKTKTGKSSIHQLSVAAHARKLGHTPHVVRSMSEFMEIANGGAK